MNKDSIFFKLNIIFFTAIVSMALIFLFITTTKSKRDTLDAFKYYRHVHNVFDQISISDDAFNFEDFLKEKHIEIIETNQDEIISLGKEIKLVDILLGSSMQNKHMGFPTHRIMRRRDFKIFVYKNNTFIHSYGKYHNIVAKLTFVKNNTLAYTIPIAIILLIFLLVVLYALLRKNLLGIKIVEKGIKEYEDGNIDILLQNTKKDEISVLSHSFYKTLVKLESIEKSRKLFLRNVIHELKTPLTKSKFYTHLLDGDSSKEDIEKNKQSIEKTLTKLEILIDEMASIEKIGADSVLIDKRKHNLIDIIDSCIDALFIDKKYISMNLEDTSIDVDFKLFVIVLKNLIDNGIKYSSDKKVHIGYKDGNISIATLGQKLPFDLSLYIEPFFKGNLQKNNKNGLGLGLYIVNEIVKKHNFSFSYQYLNNTNIFIIKSI